MARLILSLLCAASVCALRKAKNRRASSAAGAASGYIEGVPVYMADPSQASKDNWMVVFGPKATDAILDAFCESASCYGRGHPEEGGIPFVRVRATEEALQSGIAAHSADIEYLEQDYVVENEPLEESAQEN